MFDTQEALRVAVYCHTLEPDPDDIAFQKAVVTRAMNLCCDRAPQISYYVDDGICPNTQSRPGFQRLLQDVAARRIDCLAVLDWSHLASGERDTALLRRFFAQHGAHIIECQLPPAVLVRIAA
ncbi:recombinase family protein [Lysobacter antibioticus]|uniref:recombinase family protein n=1 Tax=Lysobacter antibioticus TaxID=84531 RepID=UPI0004D0276D|nr:recombinase family protein [Lysobacter antibioticus]